jgi:hypothetical protein
MIVGAFRGGFEVDLRWDSRTILSRIQPQFSSGLRGGFAVGFARDSTSIFGGVSRDGSQLACIGFYSQRRQPLQRPLAMVLNQPESDSVAVGDIGFCCQRRQPSQRPLAMVLNQLASNSVADLLRWFLVNLHQILLPTSYDGS